MKFKLFMAVILSVFVSSVFACQKYKAFDLGTLDRNQSEALQINDNTEVLGIYDANRAVFFWNLESGVKYYGDTGSQKMNDLGQIACARVRQDRYRQYDILVIEPKTGEIIRSLVLGASKKDSLKVRAFNNLGQIVFENNHILFVWDNISIKPINLFDLDHEIVINEKSELFGTAKSSYGYYIARCYQLETETVLDINPSKKTNFFGLDINNISQGIVRWKSMNGEGVFLWPMGLALSQNVRKINDKGQMLEGAVGLRDHGQLIDINKVLDLANDNSSPFERIDYINDINNRGQMVGRGIVNGIRHAVLILPLD